MRDCDDESDWDGTSMILDTGEVDETDITWLLSPEERGMVCSVSSNKLAVWALVNESVWSGSVDIIVRCEYDLKCLSIS